MSALKESLKQVLNLLDAIGAWLPQLALRLLLAHEFFQAGLAKLDGANWFGEIQAEFPFPFSALPADFNWALAIGIELFAPIALVIGLGTRAFSAVLALFTLVAIAAVHAGHGYTISEGGWKLAAIYLVMLLPLIFSGPGKLSLDHWLRQRHLSGERRLWS